MEHCHYPSLAKCNYEVILSVSSSSNKLNHTQLKDEDFTLRNIAYVSGGQATFQKMLRVQISIEEMLDE